MIKRISGELFSSAYPIWFRVLNCSILLPILLWPYVLYATIFFFDNPKSLWLTYLLFFSVIAYPVYLVAIAYLNTRLYRSNKILGSILPSAVLIVLIGGASSILIAMSQKVFQSIQRDIKRANQGFIGTSNVYKIKDNNVYRYDTLIIGADAKTFELLSWEWQRDKQYYYYNGKRIEYIDRTTFEELGYHYGKDKFNVYYDEKVILGADAKTFVHIDGTQDGKDANSCYRWGKKTNCDELEKEY